jgi:hypothetical protein
MELVLGPNASIKAVVRFIKDRQACGLHRFSAVSPMPLSLSLSVSLSLSLSPDLTLFLFMPLSTRLPGPPLCRQPG